MYQTAIATMLKEDRKEVEVKIGSRFTILNRYSFLRALSPQIAKEIF